MSNDIKNTSENPQKKKRGRASKQVVTFRRTQVAKMYLKGRMKKDIAAHFGLSNASITKDIKAIHTEWKEDRLSDFDDMMQKELMRLDLVENQAWIAWEKSIEDTHQKSIKQTTGDLGERTEKAQKELTMLGNPRYLDIMLKCSQQRSELLGLNAAKKLDHTTNGKEIQGTVVLEISSSGAEIVKQEE